MGKNVEQGRYGPKAHAVPIADCVFVPETDMLVTDATKFIGQFVHVTYLEPGQPERITLAEIFDVNFVPLKGPCLITDLGDFRLDRVAEVTALELRKVA
ncbi:MAG: hypothetical protein KF812_06665 [Fimbriimonadaceae bacterium]|nr:hypothetical protein [Fimbriimonadaceae bacterium]